MNRIQVQIWNIFVLISIIQFIKLCIFCAKFIFEGEKGYKNIFFIAPNCNINKQEQTNNDFEHKVRKKVMEINVYDQQFMLIEI